MTTSTLTVSLPEQVVRRLEEAARASRRSVEDVAARSIEGNLPPTVASAPADLRGDLMAMESLPDETLLETAESQVTPERTGATPVTPGENGLGGTDHDRAA